jgi:hypothetical protein
MPIPAYRAKQSTNTTGTGTIVLNAADTNARNFSAAYGASSRRIMYAISWSTGFEIGLGDFDGGTPGNLTRATVLASSNAGALVTLPAGTKDVFAVFDPAAREVVAISGTATLALADLGNAVVFTGASAATLNLPAVATAPTGSGWMVRNAGTAALTIDPSGAETINGASTLVLQAGQAAFIFDGGAAWECIIAGQPLNSAVIADSASGAPVDIASAATTDIGASASPNVRITGTTSITSFGTVAAGTRRFLAFAAALTLTHNATSLILPGAANITTAAGDMAVARSLGSGNWVIESFTRAAGLPIGQIATSRVLGRRSAGTGAIEDIPVGNDATGLSLAINRGTEQATTSGTAIDFTSIPAGVRRITVMLNGVSTNGSALVILQLGAGSIVTSGYGSSGFRSNGTAVANTFGTNGLLFDAAVAASDIRTGHMVLTNISGNTWIATAMLANDVGQIGMATGKIALSGVLDRLRLTAANGTDTFDAGAINIMWEF